MREYLLHARLATWLSLALAALFIWFRSFWISDSLWLECPAYFEYGMVAAQGNCSFYRNRVNEGLWMPDGAVLPPPELHLTYRREPMDYDSHLQCNARAWNRLGLKGWTGSTHVMNFWCMHVPIVAVSGLPLVGTLAGISWSTMGARRRRSLRPRGLCNECGYDLRASKERCPECGTPIPSNQAK